MHRIQKPGSPLKSRYVSPIALLLALVLTSIVFASDVSAAEPPTAKAIDILSGESIIVSQWQDAIHGGQPYEMAWAFTVIAKEARDPVAVFTRLARGGSFYGLIGLRKLDQASYRAELAAFSGTAQVRILTGDSFVDMSAEDFIKRDLEHYGDAMFEKLVFATLPRWEDTVKVSVTMRDRRDTLLNTNAGATR